MEQRRGRRGRTLPSTPAQVSCRWWRKDYEAPVDADTDNDYKVTVKATDADDNAAMASITVSVTDVAETATLAVTGLADTTVAENAAFTSWTPGLTGTPIGAVTWTAEGTDAGGL